MRFLLVAKFYENPRVFQCMHEWRSLVCVCSHISLLPSGGQPPFIYDALYTYFLLLPSSGRLFRDSANTKSLHRQIPDTVWDAKTGKAGERWLPVSIKGKREMVLKVVREMLQQLANFLWLKRKKAPFVLLEWCTQTSWDGVITVYMWPWASRGLLYSKSTGF